VLLFCSPALADTVTGLPLNISKAADIIDAYDRQQKSLGSIAFRFENSFGETGEVKYDGKNIHVIQNLFRGNQRTNPSYCENVVFEGQYMIFEQDTNDEDISIMSSLKPTIDDLGVTNFFRYGFLFGVIPYDNYNRSGTITDYLRNSTLDIVNISDNNITLKGRNGHFSVEVVFLPKFGFAIQHLSIIKDENIIISLENTLDIVSFIVDYDQYHLVNGVFVPSKVVSSYQIITTRGEKRGDKYIRVPAILTPAFEVELTLTDFQVKKSFSEDDFVLSNKVPNGIPVSMQDVPQIQYIWFDGKIEPKTNE
jgi:hypothetical protein